MKYPRMSRLYSAATLALGLPLFAGCFLGATVGAASALGGGGGGGAAAPIRENQPPAATNVEVTATTIKNFINLSGDITVKFTLQDVEAEPVTLKIQYSDNAGGDINAGDWVDLVQTGGESIAGKEWVTSAPPGTPYTFVWNSGEQLSKQQKTGLYVRVVPFDAKDKEGVGGISTPFNIDNNGIPSVDVTTPSGTNITGVVDISYTIIDIDSDLVNVVVQYSTDAGRNFKTATGAADSEGIVDLASSDAGSAHLFKWDSLKDLGRVTSDKVQIRITPADIKQGISDTTESFTIRNNDAPLLSGMAVQGITDPATDKVSADVVISSLLTDSNSDPISVLVEYALDGSTYKVATPRFGTNVTGLASSPDDPATTPIEGATSSFVWDTLTDLGESYNGAVSLRMTPSDPRDPGALVNLGFTFVVDNNKPPSVTLTSTFAGATKSGDVFITYRIADSNSDPADLAVEYSLDGGTTFTTAQENTGSALSQGVSALVTSPNGVQSVFVWDTAAQISGVASDVILRLLPTDTTDNSSGTEALSASFKINNTSPPVIAVATPSGNQSGLVNVSYFLVDDDGNPTGDPASIAVDFSTDSGATYTPASMGTGGDGVQNLGTSDTGVLHVYVWNSVNDVGVVLSDLVRLRFTPSDSLTGKAVITPVFSVDNSLLAASNTPPIVTVQSTEFSTDNGQTYASVNGTTAKELVKVTYNLSDTDGDPVDPADGDPVNLTMEYSTDFGQTWSPAGELLPAPVVTGVTPDIASNAATTAVTISGAAFSGATGAALDDPGSTALQNFLITGGGTITAQVPTGVTPGVYNVIVTTPRGANTRSFPQLTVYDAGSALPVVTDVSPASARNTALASLTVAGRGFSATMSAARLDDASNTAITNTSVLLDTLFVGSIAAGVTPGSYNVLATTVNGTNASSSLKFTVTDAATLPVVETVSPTSITRLAGGLIIIRGTGLTAAQGARLSDSGGTALTGLTLVSDTEIRATVPAATADLGTFNVIVTGEGGGENTTSGVRLTIADTGGTQNLTSSPFPGTTHAFVWDSRADIGASFSPGLILRLTAEDKDGIGIPATTAAFPIDNNTAPDITLNSISGTQSGDISLGYTLVDAEGDTVSLTPEYSLDSGATWHSASTAATGDGVSGITSAKSPGVPRTWVWASITDLGPQAFTGVLLRLTPADSVKSGVTRTSASFDVDNNTPPFVSSISTPAGVQRGDVNIIFELKDSNSDAANLVIEYSTDGGGSWVSATLSSGGTQGVATSPTGVSHTITWDSLANMGATASGQVRMRITPSDSEPGSPVSTANFTVYNATPPTVSPQSPTGVMSGDIPISYTLTDPESNSSSIFVEFTTDGGITWAPASQSPGGDGAANLATSPGGTAHTFMWNGLDAGPNPTNNARIRITPTDELPGATPGAPGETADFTVNNQGEFNFPPSVSNLSTPTTLQSGDVTFTFDISDPDADDNAGNTLRIVVEYRKTSQSTWQTATVGGSVNNLTTGTGYSFTWNSGTDAAGQNTDYQIQITPFDRPEGFVGTPPMQQGGSLSSGAFEVDNQAPAVTVVQPDAAGIKMAGGAPLTITWTTTDGNKDTVTITLLSGGSTVETVASGVADTGSFVWNHSALDDSNLKIRVQATDKVGLTGQDESNNPYEVDSTDPVIDVTFPENGETLTTGTQSTITWSSTDANPSTVRIQFNPTGNFSNPGTVTLFSSTPDDGAKNWTPAPDQVTTTGIIRIRGTDSVGNKGSWNKGAGTFIVKASIVTQPYTWTTQSDFDTFSLGGIKSNSPAGSLTIAKRFTRVITNHYPSLAVDVLNGDSNKYLVGTATGLLFTSNGGGAFQKFHSNTDSALPHQFINDVCFLQDGVGNTWLVATFLGVCLTTDGGANWTNWRPNTSPGIPSYTVRAVDFWDQDTTGKTWIIGTDGGAAVTTDGGQSFTWYTSPVIPSNDVRDVEFYSAPDVTTASVFLIGTNAGAARTTNGGSSFQFYTTTTDPGLRNSNYVRGVDFFEGMASPWGRGGESFGLITEKYKNSTGRVYINQDGGGWEMDEKLNGLFTNIDIGDKGRAIAFSDKNGSANTFVLCADNGVAYFQDTWSDTPTTRWTNNEWGNNDAQDAAFFGGTPSDEGDFFVATVWGTKFTQDAGGTRTDAIGAANDIGDPNVKSVSLYKGSDTAGNVVMLLGTNGVGAYWSGDGGATFQNFTPETWGGKLPDNDPKVVSVDIWDAGDMGRTIAMGTSDGMFWTREAEKGNAAAGTKLTNVGQNDFDQGSSDMVNAVDFYSGDPTEDDRFVCGTNDAAYYTKNGGASWQKTHVQGGNNDELLSERVTGVAFYSADATNKDDYVIVTKDSNGDQGGIHLTTNGNTFTKVQGPLPSTKCRSVDILDVIGGPKHVVVGTDNGLWVSHDQLATGNSLLGGQVGEGVAFYNGDPSGKIYGMATSNSGGSITVNDGAFFFPANEGTNPPLFSNKVNGLDITNNLGVLTLLIGTDAGAFLGPVKYIPSGTFRAMAVDPQVLLPAAGTFAAWRSMAYNGDKPLGANITFQFRGPDGNLIPDATLPGNSAGIPLDPANVVPGAEIDLSALSASSYAKITVVGKMFAVAGGSGTPRIDDLTVEMDFQN